jgi:serine/threonine protein kinase
MAQCYALTSCDSHKTYAAKVIGKEKLRKPTAKKSLLNEITLHHTLQHPHVVEFQRSFETEENIYLLLEYCPSQSLMGLLKERGRFSEAPVRTVIWQLLSALTYLHGTGIIHRDVKLGNLLLGTDGQLRIGGPATGPGRTPDRYLRYT